jgi:DNA modification methylase
MAKMARPSKQKSQAEPRLALKFEAKRLAWARNPRILKTHHRFFTGDARRMEEAGTPGSVHLILTSPPYWNLKTYADGTGAQMGNMPDYAEFLVELDKVWKRCNALLAPGGRLCVVVGDICIPRKKAGRHFVVPLHADISRRCVDLGLDYLSPIYWNKIANARTEVAGNGATFLGKPYEPNGIIKNDVEYILMFRKPGAYRTPTSEQRELSVIEKNDHERWFQQVWTDVPGQSRFRGHPAPFPEELAVRLISMFSFVGDTVLDPFCGTGTTTVAAAAVHRNSIGYEIEPEYATIARERLSDLPPSATITFENVAQTRPALRVVAR